MTLDYELFTQDSLPLIESERAGKPKGEVERRGPISRPPDKLCRLEVEPQPELYLPRRVQLRRYVAP